MKKINKKSWFHRNPKKTIFFFLIIVIFLILYITDAILGFNRQNITSSKVRYIRLREHYPLTELHYLPVGNVFERIYKSLDDPVQKKYFKARIDSNGFIMPSKIHQDPGLTIVFLGGSTTECYYVDEENRFPYLVGRIIEKKRSIKVNSYNGGFCANNTLHSLNILFNKIIPLSPDNVILMHNINDLITLLYEETYWNEHPERSPIVYINSYKSLFIFIKIVSGKIFPNIYERISRLVYDPQADEWSHIRGKELSIRKNEILSDFQKSLNSFIQICKIWEIEPVLMTQANQFLKEPGKPLNTLFRELNFINYNEFKVVYDEMNEVIRKTAYNNNVLLIDLDSLVPKETKYFRDIVHYNDTGSVFVSKCISKKLIDNGLKPLKVSSQ